MPQLLHHLIEASAQRSPDAVSLLFKQQSFSYEALWQQVRAIGSFFNQLGLEPGDRLAVYLPKIPEAVTSYFAASVANAVFVPINPLLKPHQVEHILRDCDVKVLVTSGDRLSILNETVSRCENLKTVVCTGKQPASSGNDHKPSPVSVPWPDDIADGFHNDPLNNRIDTDIAAIFYTSGSTGKPKGVVLSHRNMLCGAESVTQYLDNTAEDRLLAVLPFSFDYGFSQLTTAFLTGASAVLMDYLLPRDVIKALARYQITGLAAVPPLWNQLAQLDWPEESRAQLRYITNSGGAMPPSLTEKLQAALPATSIYLMYGLTEAFRSTYLSPEQVKQRPGSIGKAIPNAEIMILRPDGTECDDDEPGELVHRGSLVALGYWNAPEKTAERFKPIPGRHTELPLTEIAVWSGDQAYRDNEGYHYFVSRQDEMIKTSGYRVSPTEVEEVLASSGLCEETVVLGAPHPALGQAIVAVIKPTAEADETAIVNYCRQQLPNFMQPQKVVLVDGLPRNPNGKIDRSLLASQYKSAFAEVGA